MSKPVQKAFAKPSSNTSCLMALSAAAAALPAFVVPAHASAPTDTVMGYRYSSYKESALEPQEVASGSMDRYSIKVQQWSVAVPIKGKWLVALSVQDETLSGASPWYMKPADRAVYVNGNLTDQTVPDYEIPVAVMSGASPGYEDGNLVGIEEHRTDASLASTYFYPGGSVSGNVAFSTEDDYESVSFGLSTEREFDQKQTVVAAGFSYSDDDIFYEDIGRTNKRNTSDPLPDDAGKQNLSVFASVSRIVSPNAVLLAGVSYAAKEGHMSDAYKLYDMRPEEKDSYTLNLAYRYYQKAIQAAWHLDYRFYDDTWGVQSNTFSVALHKNWEKLQVVPSVRYYGQSAASFYDIYSLYRKDGIPAEQNNGTAYPKWNYYSDDARLSNYGAFTFGMKFVYKQKPVDWVLGFEYYIADEEFLPGNSDYLAHPGMIEYTRVTFGVDHRF
ncbi:MAG: DUF3570 domain-containing protein [Marinagarivorans sp.]|nr:DUF3570 domain-containing protein [Marinagarivorans sp.]